MKRGNTKEEVLRLETVENADQDNVDKNQWQYDYVRGNTDFSKFDCQDYKTKNKRTIKTTDPLTGEIKNLHLNLRVI